MSFVWVLFFVGAGNIDPINVGNAYVSYLPCIKAIGQIALSTKGHTEYVEYDKETGSFLFTNEFARLNDTDNAKALQLIEEIGAVEKKYTCIAVDYDLYERTFSK